MISRIIRFFSDVFSNTGEFIHDKLEDLASATEVWDNPPSDSEIVDQLRFMLPNGESKYDVENSADRRIAIHMLNEVIRVIWEDR